MLRARSRFERLLWHVGVGAGVLEMNSTRIVRDAFLFVMATGIAACRTSGGDSFYSTTQVVEIAPGPSLTTARRAAFDEAERLARNQILQMALREMHFESGPSLEDAYVTDPVIRAMVSDAIRAARITDRTVDEDNTRVTITLRLDQKPLLAILGKGFDPPSNP
jgi:hypothetical protein